MVQFSHGSPLKHFFLIWKNKMIIFYPFFSTIWCQCPGSDGRCMNVWFGWCLRLRPMHPTERPTFVWCVPVILTDYQLIISSSVSIDLCQVKFGNFLIRRKQFFHWLKNQPHWCTLGIGFQSLRWRERTQPPEWAHQNRNKNSNQP